MAQDTTEQITVLSLAREVQAIANTLHGVFLSLASPDDDEAQYLEAWRRLDELQQELDALATKAIQSINA
jgi:hypothetical protein